MSPREAFHPFETREAREAYRRTFSQRFARWTLRDTWEKEGRARQLVEEVANDGLVFARNLVRRKPLLPTVLRDEAWGSLSVPMLILVGAHEKHYDAARAVARIERVAPQVTIERVEGAGHDLALSQADVVNARVLAFLRG